MATQKYIGARYMPKFMGDYDATTAYEALSVVDNGAGTTYVANKSVPAGTPLTNTEYWAVYGASSGAILDLQERMTTAENSIGDIQGDITDIGNALTDIYGKIYDHRKFIFIGDSYAVGYQPGGSETEGDIEGFYNIAITALGLPASKYTLVRYGRSGFAAAGINSKTWVQDLDDLDDDSGVTDIYVVGGMNDTNLSTSAVANAIVAFITLAKSKFPNAAIHIGYCARCINSTYSFLNVRSMIKTYKNTAIDNGACYLENIENILKIPNSMASDGYHPNTDGETAISRYIINDILGYKGYSNIIGYQEFFITVNSSFVSSVNLPNVGGYSINNELVIVSNQYLEFQLQNIGAGSLNFATARLNLGTLSNLPLFGDTYYTLGVSIGVNLRGSNNKLYEGTGYLYLEDNKMMINFEAMDGSGDYANITPTSIILSPFTLNLPLFMGL